MRSLVTSKNVSWPRLIWPTLYVHRLVMAHFMMTELCEVEWPWPSDLDLWALHIKIIPWYFMGTTFWSISKIVQVQPSVHQCAWSSWLWAWTSWLQNGAASYICRGKRVIQTSISDVFFILNYKPDGRDGRTKERMNKNVSFSFGAL